MHLASISGKRNSMDIDVYFNESKYQNNDCLTPICQSLQKYGTYHGFCEKLGKYDEESARKKRNLQHNMAVRAEMIVAVAAGNHPPDFAQ